MSCWEYFIPEDSKFKKRTRKHCLHSLWFTFLFGLLISVFRLQNAVVWRKNWITNKFFFAKYFSVSCKIEWLSHLDEKSCVSVAAIINFDAINWRQFFFVPDAIGMKNWRQNLASNLWCRFLVPVSGTCVWGFRITKLVQQVISLHDTYLRWRIFCDDSDKCMLCWCTGPARHPSHHVGIVGNKRRPVAEHNSSVCRLQQHAPLFKSSLTHTQTHFSFIKGELNLDKKWQSDDLFYIIMNEIHPRFNQFCVILKLL